MKCDGCGEIVYEAFDCKCDQLVIELRKILKELVTDIGEYNTVGHSYSTCPGNEDRGCLMCRALKAVENE